MDRTLCANERELAAVNIVRDSFHTDWHYTINPHPTTNRANSFVTPKATKARLKG